MNIRGLLAFAFATSITIAPSARGETIAFTTLRAFNLADGIDPASSLVQGANGNFYGSARGSHGIGSIFEITSNGVFTQVLTFPDDQSEGCDPASSMVKDAAGNLYGTKFCSSEGSGYLFELTTTDEFSLLYQFPRLTPGPFPESFPPRNSIGTGGAQLAIGLNGHFYGAGDGGLTGGGTVYEVSPDGSARPLHSFSRNADNVQGDYPRPLALGANGILYGMTDASVFKIAKSGAITFLHYFTQEEGFNPSGPLFLGSDGNFYGATTSGGANNTGTVFKIGMDGSLTILHVFGPAEDGDTGFYDNGPNALIEGADGNFYGSTLVGGVNGTGSLFRVTPTGDFTELYVFSPAANDVNTDGIYPSALVLGTDGSFYGTTVSGGPGGSGTVFKLTITP